MYKNCDTDTHAHSQMLNWFGDKQRYFYCLLTDTDTHGDTLRQAHGVWLTRSRSTRQPAETIDFRILNCERQRRSEAPLEKRLLVSHYQHSFAGSHCLSVLSLSLSLSSTLSFAFIVIKFYCRCCCCCSCQTDQLWECLHSKPVCDTSRCANVWVLGGVCVCVSSVCLFVCECTLNVAWQGSFQYPIFVYHFTTTRIYCTC